MSASRARTGCSFFRSGEFWTLGYAGATFSLKHIKGLSYIQRLLLHPGSEFHALEILSETTRSSFLDNTDIVSLVRNPSVSIGGLGDAGVMLDEQAKREYKRRLAELREQADDLVERGDHDKASEMEVEIEFLRREISRAVGLGGRDRRTGSAAERARLSVTRAIKGALQKISEHHSDLGAMLETSIRTGSFCSYVPDFRTHVVWRFSLEESESGEHDRSSTDNNARNTAFIKRENGLLQSLAGGTALVGRELEIDILRHTLAKSLSGEGRVVLISGSPGVGKTRLAAEIGVEASKREALIFVGNCYDREDSVPFVPFVEMLESAFARAQSPESFRDSLGNDASEIARLLPELRKLFPDILMPLELPPEQSRRALFKAVADFFIRLAKQQKVVLFFDDIHWADEGTLALLNHIARSIAELPVMIVAAYRDTEAHIPRPIVKALDEMIHLQVVHRIQLKGLDEQAVSEMLHALSGHEPPETIVKLFYSDTEGNPFFVEELFEYLAEQGRLLDSTGEFRSDLKLLDIDLPQSLRLVIGRRLARLDAATVKALGTAAVIGRSFTFDLLLSATHSDTDVLLDSVEEAESAGLIVSTLEYPEARFRFSHELIRQGVVSRISVPRRQRLHLDVAQALEALHANALGEVANELAHHCLQAGVTADPAKTIRFLSMAARRARLQGAFNETGELYRDALKVLERMPNTSERDHLELGLQLNIGAVLIATRGDADASTAAAYQRATTLGERLGDPMQVVLALTGLSSRSLHRGELDKTQALADQILGVCRRDDQSKTKVWGNFIQGVVHYHAGNLHSAWEHLNAAFAGYSEDDHKRNPQDPGCESLEYLALTAWQLGNADTARARIGEAINLSQRIQKPFAITHCAFYAGYLQALLREPIAAQEFAEKAIKSCIEYSIPLYLEPARTVYGWAIAKQGRCAEGVVCIRAALESFKSAGNRLGIGAFMGFLAEALLSAGLREEAIAAVDEGLSLVPQERVNLSYLWWVRGTLFLNDLDGESPAQSFQVDKAGFEEAESSFRKAVSIASNIGAKCYAIRAATSLGRLLVAQSRSTEARTIIEPFFNGMKEGFDTRDLVEAKRLVEEVI